MGWFKDNSERKTHEAGKKLANELGNYDMSGNVWEWCFDLSGRSTRGVRGGSWVIGADYCPIAFLVIGFSPSYRSLDMGFRLARSSGN